MTFSEVVGMTELNGHPPIRVKNCKAHSFYLEVDSTNWRCASTVVVSGGCGVSLRVLWFCGALRGVLLSWRSTPPTGGELCCALVQWHRETACNQHVNLPVTLPTNRISPPARPAAPTSAAAS